VINEFKLKQSSSTKEFKFVCCSRRIVWDNIQVTTVMNIINYKKVINTRNFVIGVLFIVVLLC
jgi:hypothetical protein